MSKLVGDPTPSAPRVALFTDSDVYAGTEAHILTLARALRALGVAAGIACPRPSPLAERADEDGVTVFPVAKQGLIDQRAVSTLTGLLRSGAVQILHTHNGRTHLNAALAVRRARTGICVATQHFIAPDHSTQRGVKAWLYRRAHNWINGRTARSIAISEAVRQGMLDRHETSAERITVVPNGIEAPNTAGLKSADEVRAELGLAPRAPLIVCAARLEKEKDVASLVAAMRQVAAAVPAARCVVVGEGSLRAELQSQVSDAGLESTVALPGFRSDALAVIRAADIFVLPSLAEPFGLVILEAMALGRPVVATRAGGPLEIVVDGETGLLAPPSDPSALAAALTTLLRCPDMARQMGESGRERFMDRYQACHMARSTRNVYLQVIAQQGL